MIGFIFLLLCGGEFHVTAIDFSGNEYHNASTIKKIMLTKTKGLFRKGIFNDDVFRGDLDAIENLYVYDGFLDIVVGHELHYDSANNGIAVSIEINEGRQSFVKSINFGGNTVFQAESLAKLLVIERGNIFDPRKVDVDNYIIRYSYDDIGYADVEVESDFQREGDSISVRHLISEGAVQFVGDMEIVGLERTRESVVRRELRISDGDLFRYARILEGERRLYRLGIFSTIRTQIEAAKTENHKDIRFILSERKRISMNFRVGYGTRDRIRLGVGVAHNNMFGRAWQGRIDSKLSFVEQRVSAQVTFPRSILLPGDFGLAFFFRRLEEIGYETQSLGGNISTRFLLDASEISAKYEVERIRTYYLAEDSVERDLLHGFVVGWLRDKRDNPFYTTKGSYLGANLEINGVVLPSDIDYLRPTMQMRFYRPFIGLILAAAFKAGMVKPVAPTVNVPVYKRFYCGGTSSVRGYPERGIGPVDENDNPLGGRFLGEISAEVRFPIYKVLGGVLFVDGGNIWQNQEEIDTDLRWGVGVGLRLKSFLGSIRLDYGFKLAREEDESVGVLHFAIGEAF
ncbi:MAG: outer membrane protein assembly factor BamA [candidate division WOR-3 bacterium]|nr:outer membrane protein assembly factor BamA [candidate division WOR-3 bacterium]